MLFYQNAFGQIAVYNLQLENLYKMQTGIGWPHTLHIVEGHEALLKLASSLENQQSCEVTTNAGVSFNVQQPPSDRFVQLSQARDAVVLKPMGMKFSTKNSNRLKNVITRDYFFILDHVHLILVIRPWSMGFQFVESE